MIRERFVLGVAELGVLRILDGRMSRDVIEGSVLRRGLSKSSGTVTDAVESLIEKRLVERGINKRPAKSADDFVCLTLKGKAMRKALMRGKFI